MSTEVVAKILTLTAREVTPTERLVLLFLANAGDEETGACFANPAIIARRIGLPEETVQGIIKSLTTKGFLTVTRCPEEGSGETLRHYSFGEEMPLY